MLHVEKQNLLAETNRDIAILREMELRYYMEHIGGMQTMATLLAGFSFTALISSNTLDLDFAAFLFKDDEVTKGTLTMQNVTHGEYTEASVGDVGKMPMVTDPFRYLSFFMHVAELTSIVSSLGEMLHVITSTLIARLLGARLALRGPDGSIIRATRHLAHALNANTKSFFNGLQYFMFSVIFYLFRGQHPVVAILLTYLLYRYWRRQGVIANQLSNAFHLTKGVTTAFVDDADNDDAAAAGKPGSPATPAGAAQATWRSIQTSLNKRGSGFRNWRMKFNKFIRPVSTELQFLYDEVAEDFEGESAHANAQHRGPTAATQHLIRRNESKKLDMDAFVSPLDEYQENSLARRKQAREAAAAAAASASRVPTVLEEPEEEPDIGIQVKNAWNSARNWLHTQMDVVNVDIPAHDGLRVAAHSPTTPGARFGEQVDMARAMMERGEVVDRRDVV